MAEHEGEAAAGGGEAFDVFERTGDEDVVEKDCPADDSDGASGLWFGFYNLWGEDAEVGAVKGVVGLDAGIELLFSVEGRCDVVEEIPHGDFSGRRGTSPERGRASRGHGRCRGEGSSRARRL